MQAASVAGLVLHVLHYALLAIGGAAVVVLVIGSARAPTEPRPQQQRADRLREAARAGRLATPDPDLRTAAPADAPGDAPGAASAAGAVSYADSGARTGPTLAAIAVVSSLGAALVHAVATPDHFDEAAALGGFLLAAAIGQVGWALLMAKWPGTTLAVAGALGNAGMVGLWAYTRTAGIPFGLGGRESVGAWDLTATILELAVVASCLALLARSARTAAFPRPAATPPARLWAAVVAASLLLVALTGSSPD